MSEFVIESLRLIHPCLVVFAAVGEVVGATSLAGFFVVADILAVFGAA
nr:hypothetical protein [Corynebacterium tuberculostearicum]